jgi:high-affinity Fe2+/Pb2+ permease
MGTGLIILVAIIGIFGGLIPIEFGIFNFLMWIIIAVVFAFLLWGVTYIYNKKESELINKQIKKLQNK